MAAARRKGKWVGGTPVLGYDIADTGGKLVVNAGRSSPSASDLRRYICSIDPWHRVLAEIQARHWTTKRWRTRDGKEQPGTPFTKATLERLLKNVLYLGKVSHQDTVYAGEQAPIVEEAVWKLVNEKLAQERNRASVAAGSEGERQLPRRAFRGRSRASGTSATDHAVAGFGIEV